MLYLAQLLMITWDVPCPIFYVIETNMKGSGTI